MSASKEKDIGWMYEGAKALVNREDYLLGKKVDKNFEKYSDAVNQQKPEALDSLLHTRTVARGSVSSGIKTSSLETQIIKTEDPLVAVKVKEETKRRELMDNPLMKLKFQKMLKEMMVEKEKKSSKKSKKSKRNKKKKKKRSRDSSPSEDDSDSADEVKKQRRVHDSHHRDSTGHHSSSTRRDIGRSRDRAVRTEDVSRGRKSSREDRRDCHRSSSSHEDDSRRRRSSRRKSSSRSRSRDRSERRKPSSSDVGKFSNKRRSPQSSRSRSPPSRKRVQKSPEADRRTHRKPSARRRHDSSDSDASSEGTSTKRRRVSRSPKRVTKKSERDASRSRSPVRRSQLDSHIPEHLRPKASTSSSDSEDSYEDKGDKEERERKKKYEGWGLVGVKKKSVEEDGGRVTENPYKLTKMPTAPVFKKLERRKPLTDEEKAVKLKEMQANTEWRNETRNRNMKRTVEEDEKEVEDEGKAPSFIRAQLNSATSDLSIEQRLQSNKKSLQRSHGYMERKFTSK